MLRRVYKWQQSMSSPADKEVVRRKFTFLLVSKQDWERALIILHSLENETVEGGEGYWSAMEIVQDIPHGHISS